VISLIRYGVFHRVVQRMQVIFTSARFKSAALGKWGIWRSGRAASLTFNYFQICYFLEENESGRLSRLLAPAIPFGIMLAFFASAFFLQGVSTDWPYRNVAGSSWGDALQLIFEY